MCNIIYIAGNGIEPLYKDFQSNALPLSYPADQMKHYTQLEETKCFKLEIVDAGFKFLGQH